MKTVTIKMKNGDTIYTGGTARAKTLEKAIELARKETSNEWNLKTWAELADGTKVDYKIVYNAETGKEEIFIQ